MLLNKDTKIYGSFSLNPGNNGCLFFNKKFQENKINAIYKSFYSDNIFKSIEAVKTLGIAGFAVSMPFKIEILQYVDEIDDIVVSIGAANTVINNNGYLKAYNTDWLGVYNYFLSDIPEYVNILGNGGFSKAAQFAFDKLNIESCIITRKEWDKISELKGVIFNATPIDININGHLIDGRPFTEEGKQIALLQAEEQYKIYINEQY
jgi:shikimate 5-dehydrogenase